MPLLAAFLASHFAKVFGFFVSVYGVQIAARLSLVAALAALYIASLILFNGFISPNISKLFSTSFGQVIGLAFPPIAGTVVTGLSFLWVSLLTYRYVRSLSQVLVS